MQPFWTYHVNRIFYNNNNNHHHHHHQQQQQQQGCNWKGMSNLHFPGQLKTTPLLLAEKHHIGMYQCQDGSQCMLNAA